MYGWIESRQKCPICGGALVHDEKRRGCYCIDHPRIAATRFIVRFPGDIYQRFRDYTAATQRLNYLRHERGERQQHFNPHDYRTARPNSFFALAPKYLDTKKALRNINRISTIINHAANHFGLANIREIGTGEIEDYLYSLKKQNGDAISEKTRFNRCSQLHDFWMWCRKRRVITLAEFPDFPDINYDLGYRKITNWETQEQVLDRVREISAFNPKIALAIDMLATYTALRPDDLRRCKENSLDAHDFLTIFSPTKRKNRFKTIRIHEDHATQWRALQKECPALPEALFFRHVGGVSGCAKNEPFGNKYLYKWWVRACNDIGLKGVPLYPGTKHTTATETAKLLGSEKAEEASGLTNKAFKRYCQVETSNAFETVAAIRKQKAKVIGLPKRALHEQRTASD